MKYVSESLLGPDRDPLNMQKLSLLTSAGKVIYLSLAVFDPVIFQ